MHSDVALIDKKEHYLKIIQAVTDYILAVALVDGTGAPITTTGGAINTNVINTINAATIQLFTIPFDAITVTYPTNTQEIYQSRVGGIAGAVQQTATINYTDSTKNSLLNASRV